MAFPGPTGHLLEIPADPQLAFESVGAMPVMWNHAEWLNSKRGV